MSLNFQLEPRAGYLHATATGEYTAVDEAQAQAVQILQACAEHGLTRALVDLRAVTGQMSPIHRHEFAEFVWRQRSDMLAAGKLRDLRIVYVDNDEIGSSERFSVTASRNRGLDSITTSDMDEALKWLGVGPA
jgi:hypothetical protein